MQIYDTISLNSCPVFQAQFVDKINTQILCAVIFFPPKIFSFLSNVENPEVTDGPQMAV